MKFENILGTVLSIETGYIKDIQIIFQWAEIIISELDKPPQWIMDVYDSKTLREVLIVLRTTVNKMSSLTKFSGLDWVEVYLGFLYLRFKDNELSILDLLLMCGEKTDLSNYKIDCSYFFALANKIKEEHLSQEEKQSILSEVDLILQPMAAFAISTLPKEIIR